jgi:hypothetical protein
LVKFTKSLKIHLIEQRTGKYKYKYSDLFSLRRSENIKTSKQPFFKPESGFRHLPASDTKTSPPHEPISDLHRNTFDHIHLACPNVNPATSDGSDNVHQDTLPLSEQERPVLFDLYECRRRSHPGLEALAPLLNLRADRVLHSYTCKIIMASQDNKDITDERLEIVDGKRIDAPANGNVDLLDDNGNVRRIPVPSSDPNDPLNMNKWRKLGIIITCCWYSIFSLILVGGAGPILPFFIGEYARHGYAVEEIVKLTTYPSLVMALGE